MQMAQHTKTRQARHEKESQSLAQKRLKLTVQDRQSKSRRKRLKYDVKHGDAEGKRNEFI